MAQAKDIFRRHVTVTDTVESNLGVVGELRAEGTNLYRLFQAGASIADGGLLQLDTVSASAGYIVEPAILPDQPIHAVNQCGTSVPDAGYFFGQVKGIMTVRSADINAVSMALNAAVCLDSGATPKLGTVVDAVTTVHPRIVQGQFIGAASRASDATDAARFYLVCQGI